jgi:hypothetical protein
MSRSVPVPARADLTAGLGSTRHPVGPRQQVRVEHAISVKERHVTALGERLRREEDGESFDAAHAAERLRSPPRSWCTSR